MKPFQDRSNSMIAKGMIEAVKLISSMIAFQRNIICLKWISYAKIMTPPWNLILVSIIHVMHRSMSSMPVLSM
jgi:hypothetical protein